MELGRCPICHHRISLEAIAKDQAGRELLAVLARLDDATAQALIGYLGLFRSPTRDLSNDRALALAKDALALEAPQWLVPALQQTTDAIHTKRANGGQVKPLKNHNYLKEVLASVIAGGVIAIEQRTERKATEHHASSTASRQRLEDTDW
ncbi:MAG: hypothetical protein CMI09_11755 [Oceanospirillaceae bacterium]|nr:hypothetical protein [Oceanospirillaceae bacterium]